MSIDINGTVYVAYGDFEVFIEWSDGELFATIAPDADSHLPAGMVDAIQEWLNSPSGRVWANAKWRAALAAGDVEAVR